MSVHWGVDICLTQELAGSSSHADGFHDYRTRVTFAYPSPDSTYTPEREQELVRAILGSSWMWYTATSPAPHEWVVAHGYDSGD